MASVNYPRSERSVTTRRRQESAVLSNDPTYLLELLDTIDSDDSDDDFEGYIDDFMQPTINLHDDTLVSTHTLDEHDSTHAYDDDSGIQHYTMTMNDDNTAASSAADIQLASFPTTQQQLPVPPPTVTSVQEATSPDTVDSNDCIQSTEATVLPVQLPATPSAATAIQVNSQPLPATVLPSSHTELPQFTECPGVVPDMSDKEPGEFFDLMLSDDIITEIHHETNTYAQQYLQNKAEHLQQHPQARCAAYQGKPIQVPEIKAALAITIIMGIISLPSLPLYWSSKWPFHFPTFSAIMPRNRFQLILKFLHFNDNEKHIPRGEPGHDRLFKIRPFMTKLISNFQKVYIPFKNISIDESMVGFKGRISFLQYMPKKPQKWGMKAWALCDSKTGYVWNWKLYVGKDDEVNTTDGLAYGVVMKLINGLLCKGYHLYCDNFYSSPTLFRQLYSMGTGACGTVRIDRRGLPLDFQKTKLRKGDIMTFKNGPLMGLKWMDKRQVAMLSTIHDDATINKRRRTRRATDGVEVIKKPKVIEEYNSYMGGVDKADQLITYYGFSHRTSKWYKRTFFHLFEVSIVNAYILYCLTVPTKQRLSHLDFRLAIASHLLSSFLPSTPTRNAHITNTSPLRLTGRHFLALHDKAHPDCKVCSARKDGKRKQTKYYCKQCNVSMCPVPCFERYHTLVNYKL